MIQMLVNQLDYWNLFNI